ncbi:Agglutinin [Morella rubra]|uniref:Agglutinin n=1 Tax=Morella rubra TaxID=262757 RepID=A0A6A1WCQ1_9ROSI|nr:Agglutinin [Morella rubra]
MVEAASLSVQESLKNGPWGGEGGIEWSFKPSQGGSINEIAVMTPLMFDHVEEDETSDDLLAISKLTMEMVQSSTLKSFGGYGPSLTDKILYLGEDLCLTSISGTFGYGQQLSRPVLMAKYGPYSSETGTPFSLPMEGGAIVGFHGRADNRRHPLYWGAVELMNSVVPSGPGPWGGPFGKQWDDGVFKGIHELHLESEDLQIHSLQIVYETTEVKQVWSQKHGGTQGYRTILLRSMKSAYTNMQLKLDSPEEFLVGISGFYGPVAVVDDDDGRVEALLSITFHTNYGSRGTFGYDRERGAAFHSTLSDRAKIVGFHGRSSEFHLDAVRFHMSDF